MTLLELLVVVAILAVLATIAVQSTSQIGDQTRFESTQKTVDSFRGAVLGPQGQIGPDGGSLLSGFLSDMGRLPFSSSITSASGDQGALVELYAEALPPGLQAYGVHTVNPLNTVAIPGTAVDWSLHTNEVFVGSVSGGFVRVPAGWRGPYLRKPASQYTIVDGWEKPIVSRWDKGTNIDLVDTWPSGLLEFRTNSAAYPYRMNGDYTPILTSYRPVSGLFTQSGFEGAPVTGAYAGQFESLISQSEIRNAVLVQVTAPTGKYSTTSSFSLLLTVYGPNPNVSSDGRPIQVVAQQVTFSSNPIQIVLSSSLAPTVGVRVFRASLKTNNVANPSLTNYVRSAPMVVPITRYTQSINIPLP